MWVECILGDTVKKLIEPNVPGVLWGSKKPLESWRQELSQRNGNGVEKEEEVAVGGQVPITGVRKEEKKEVENTLLDRAAALEG